MSLLSQAWNRVQDSLGRPQSLEKWLASIPAADRSAPLPLTSSSIAVSDIVRWDRLGAPMAGPSGRMSGAGEVRGWRKEGDGYRSTETKIQALAHLTEVNERPWQGDLQDIQGLASSKSPLDTFASMDEFARSACADWIAAPSPTRLTELLSWEESKLFSSTRPPRLANFAWDGRTLLLNDGGSHHVAAAQHMARALDRPVPVTGHLATHGFNTRAVDQLRHQFDMFVLPAALHDHPEFFESLRAVGATHYTLPLPPPHSQLRAVMLPRNEPRSVAVADVLRQAGITDFGAHLTSLAYGLARHPAAPQVRTETVGQPTVRRRESHGP